MKSLVEPDDQLCLGLQVPHCATKSDKNTKLEKKSGTNSKQSVATNDQTKSLYLVVPLLLILVHHRKILTGCYDVMVVSFTIEHCF